MQRHNSFTALWKAFYSKDLYQDVKQNWGFNVLWYLFFVVAICTFITAAHDIVHAKRFYKEVVVPVVDQVPVGSLVDGKLTIDKPSPYTIGIRDTKTNKLVPLAVFDMNNQVKASDTDAIVIFHQHDFLVSETHSKTHVDAKKDSVSVHSQATTVNEWKKYDLKGNYNFSPQIAHQYIDKLWISFPIILTAFGILFGMIFRLMQALIYSLIVLIFGAVYKEQLVYAEAYRLALVAVGPSILIVTILSIAIPHVFHHRWLIAFIIQVIYLFFAAYSNRGLTARVQA